MVFTYLHKRNSTIITLKTRIVTYTKKKCKEFKDNETYMIEYGTYLNTHKLAVSLDNENTSFQEKERMINEKREEIMKILENRKHIG